MISPSTERRYPLATICGLRGLSRVTLHRQRARQAANDPRRPRRRGPQGAASDAELRTAFREVIEALPFKGEGCRKIGARLRLRGLRTAARRVRRLMQAHALLAPHRPAPLAARPHDGTVLTERVDQVWHEPACATGSSRPANDITETFTTAGGRAYIFAAVDHCSGAFVGIHAALGANRGQALEPIRQGVARHFGAIDRPGIASGLTLRHDRGSSTMSADFHREIRFLGMTSAPAFVRQPEGNSVAERAIRTLKEQLLWVRHFATVEELRQALTALAAEYNASWMRQRHSYETPEQIRAEQQALETDAAKALKMAA